MNKPKCKDIPEGPILEFLWMLREGKITSCYCTGTKLESWQPSAATIHSGFAHSITNAISHGYGYRAPNLVRAKMKRMIRKGLINGCTCGCRGDFEITSKGFSVLAAIQTAKDLAEEKPE